jgi:hypothetical protein
VLEHPPHSTVRNKVEEQSEKEEKKEEKENFEFRLTHRNMKILVVMGRQDPRKGFVHGASAWIYATTECRVHNLVLDDKRKKRNNMLFSLVIERWGRENRKLAVEVDR